jgi:hypothetical protein
MNDYESHFGDHSEAHESLSSMTQAEEFQIKMTAACRHYVDGALSSIGATEPQKENFYTSSAYATAMNKVFETHAKDIDFSSNPTREKEQQIIASVAEIIRRFL